MENLATTKSGKKVLILDVSSQEVMMVLKRIIKDLDENSCVERDNISPDDLEILDKFVAQALGEDCKVNSAEGCNSCCADGISSSLLHTTCGDVCSKVCGEEPCH